MATIQEEIKQKAFLSTHQKAIVNILFTASWLQLKHLQTLKPYGISTQQYNVLRILRGQYPNPASIGVITDRMIDKTSNASRIVEKLVQKGLVTRKTCTEDRRAVDVLIHETGLAILKELDAKVDALENINAVLNVNEAETLSNLLDKLRTN